MQKSTIYCVLIHFALFQSYIILSAASGTYGGVVPNSSVKCECYNANNSTTDEVCKSKEIMCSADRGGCYAVWDTSNVTGKKPLLQ